MAKYVLKRILILIPIMIAVSFIVFSILYFTPADPARIMLGASAPQDALDKMRAELGLDKPFLVQYGNYMWGVLHGDFGVSYRSRQSVFLEIFARFPVTLKLAGLSIVTVSVLGIFFGVVSAVRQYSVLDRILTVFSMLAASIPSFWLGLMMMLFFSLKLGILPSYGVDSGWKSYVMPVIALSLPSLAEVIRMTRSAMLDTIHQDYIRTARAKGQTERKIITRHALRNALLPVVTVLGVSFGTMLAGTVTVETVFSLPGVGLMIIEGIRMKDVPVVTGATVVLAAMFTVLMLFVDILYAFIDPRIKARYAKK